MLQRFFRFKTVGGAAGAEEALKEYGIPAYLFKRSVIVYRFAWMKMGKEERAQLIDEMHQHGAFTN